MPIVSVFTAVETDRSLLNTHGSLAGQSLGTTDWEWIIACRAKDRLRFPDAILNDQRVLVIEVQETTGPVTTGQLLRQAVAEAKTDLLVELEQDDELDARALGHLLNVRQRNPAIGFFYSDWAAGTPSYAPIVYDARFGWETYSHMANGRNYTAMRTFPLLPCCFPYLQFMPNHLRAWTRQGYAAAGGYDAATGYNANYDLMCRTYLAQIETLHIHDCLYFSRLSDQHPQQKHRDDRSKLETSNKYTDLMAREWCRRQQLQAINIQENNSLLDVDEISKIETDSVGYLRGYDVLQLLPQSTILPWFQQVYRILAPGAWFTTATPSTDGKTAFIPGYQSYWNEYSFWPFTHAAARDRLREPLSARFAAVRKWTHQEGPEAYVYADLVALKGQPHAGLVEI